MQRKSTKKTRGPNALEKDFQGWLKQRPCIITGRGPVEVHHCKGATFRHNKTLIGHAFCIPLHHDTHMEYHAGTKAWRETYGPQSLYFERVHDDWFSATGNRFPDDVLEAIRDYAR